MIKINVLQDLEFQKLNWLAAKFERERATKSFSERHPELGRMINCPVCLSRHRLAHVCTPVYAKHKTLTVNAEDGSTVPMPMMAANTRRGVLGAKTFKGQRFSKHRNAWGLQVLERATTLFRKEIAFYPNLDPKIKEEQEFIDKLGKQSLSRSLNELRSARAARRRNLFLITRKSRSINRASR